MLAVEVCFKCFFASIALNHNKNSWLFDISIKVISEHSFFFPCSFNKLLQNRSSSFNTVRFNVKSCYHILWFSCFRFSFSNIFRLQHSDHCWGRNPLFERSSSLFDMFTCSMGLKCFHIFKAFNCYSSSFFSSISEPIIPQVAFLFSCSFNQLFSGWSWSLDALYLEFWNSNYVYLLSFH